METIARVVQGRRLHRLTPRWIERAIAGSFAPERAAVNFSRFIEKVEETAPGQLEQLNKRNIPWIAALFSGSQALTDMAMRDPEWLFWCLHPGVLHSTRFKRDMRHERMLMAGRFADPKEALLNFKNRELMRIGWRDLLKWADTVETIEDLSRLADVTIEGAMNAAEEEMTERFGQPLHPDGSPSRFIVLGMGKLGGRELNFSSDIDLIYFYDDDEGETAGGVGRHGMERQKISIREYWSRAAQRMTGLLNDVGPQGAIYRVDMNLRPEGTRGPLTCSLAAAELYYESWGQPWERQMMIKARVVAGSESLADAFYSMIRPFVYRKSMDFTALRDIQNMKEKIDKHLKTGKNRYDNNVKLGKGGIREVEFIIQAYQLIYGGKLPWFAETNSLKALHRIFERGLMGHATYANLADALLFLRDLENRMQITYGRQVQILPEGDELRELALKMNLAGDSHLMAEYRRHAENVNAVFTAFFKEEAADETPYETFLDIDNEESSLTQLAEMGFQHPRETLTALLHIRDGEPFNHPSNRSRKIFMRILPGLIRTAADLPLKDRVIANLDRFFGAHPGREAHYEIFEQFPPSVDILLSVMALAQNLADSTLIQQDMIDILSQGYEPVRPEPLANIPAGMESYDQKLDWLRKERNSESLRIGIAYLTAHRDQARLMGDLSRLAAQFVQRCLDLITEEMGNQGTAFGGSFAVIGMGKMGRRALTYGSDLDLMFIYGDDGSKPLESQSYYTTLARRLLAAVGGISQYGQAYRVDARLRPEGEKGNMVITKKAALEYYAVRGELWERMALTGARIIAGDKAFGDEVLASFDQFVYAPGLAEADSVRIDKMKKKMEREKIKGHRKGAIKYGPGGIVDIEFHAQKIKLGRVKDIPELRPCNTLETLLMARAKGWAGADIDDVIASYKLLRRVEIHMRMEYGRGAESLPHQTGQLRILQEILAPFEELKGSLEETIEAAMARAHKAIHSA